jgi:MerR family transcriptional regulator, light-induced transcriptional regulator
LRTLKTSEAAALLHVTPNTLRTWERRFGYPKPHRLPGGTHRIYAYAEIAALHEALGEGDSYEPCSSAVVSSCVIRGGGHTLADGLTDPSSDARAIIFR